VLALVEIKRRSAGHTEGVDPVLKLLGIMGNRGATGGVVVSTADKFSPRAYEEQAIAGEYGKVLTLCDNSRLLDLLRATLPKVELPYNPLWQSDDQRFSKIAMQIVE
jgi:hypothetical protein